MAGVKQPPCPLGPKHRWVHARDVMLKTSKSGPNGTYTTMSARGEYKCECGAKRLGTSRGGL